MQLAKSHANTLKSISLATVFYTASNDHISKLLTYEFIEKSSIFIYIKNATFINKFFRIRRALSNRVKNQEKKI